MHIVATSKLKKFWEKHPSSKTSLQVWCKVAETTDWQSPIEVKESFSSADKVGKFIVFDIGGDKYRLITYIDYKYNKIFIRNILTHSEYSKDVWKKDKWY